MIYFLSDAHLGSKAFADGEAHQQRVVSLLNQMSKDASAIYMLGDMFDFWYEYFIPQCKRQFAPFLQCLKALTAKGIEVHFFTGNHDMWTFGWLERVTGVIVHHEPLTTTLCGKKVFLAHGDGLVPADYLQQLPEPIQKKIRRFKALRQLFHNPIAQTLFRCMPPCIGDAMGYAWAKHSRLKDLQQPCGYKGENEEELVLWAKEMENGEWRNENGHDYYIFGHRHIELDLMINRHARVILLGDLFRTFTYAQMDEKGDIQLCIQEQNS